MSEIQFGERHFATREQLAALMRRIADLAAHTGTELNGHLSLKEWREALSAPILFAVCGEVNAGKSTLLNGLFGHDLCRVNLLPETDRVLVYRFGNPATDTQISAELEERHRPVNFLRNFNLVDTPGTDSLAQNHQAATEKFLTTADLVFCVFPVTNPWGAATWDLISRMPASIMERTVLVIQQADLRQEADIAVILEHMADLAMKRTGQVPPIFAVSGKLAYEAKSQPPTDNRTISLAKSGFPMLERFISNRICESPSRRQTLETWRAKAAAALRAVEDRIEDQNRTLHHQGRFLESIEREIDDIRERFVTRLPRHLTGVAEVFETEAVWVSKRLHRSLGVIPSFFRLFVGDRTGPKMESFFSGRLQIAVEAVAQNDGNEVVDACRAHWNELVGRVKATVNVDMGDPAPIEETLEAAKQQFVKRLGSAARHGIGNLKVRNQLDKDLRKRNVALKSFIFMTLILTTAGATCGAFGLPWLPAILCGLALLFLIGGAITALITRKSIKTAFQRRLLNTCGGFAANLRVDYEEALRIVFKDHRASLGAVRTHLAHKKIAVEPSLKLWQELFLTLKALEQDL